MVSESGSRTERPAVLAFDLGASSGRAIVGRLDREQGIVTVEELHRFPNDPVRIGERMHWDILRLLHEIKQGFVKAKQMGVEAASFGIDSWAVDYGLISDAGELLGNPYHYRDNQNDGVMESVIAELGADVLYAKTGLQFLPFNTIFQLKALQRRQSPLLGQAKALLMIPDLLRYFLTAEMRSEYSNATTTQLLNASTGRWDEELLEALGLPAHLFLPPLPSGTRAGQLTAAVAEELGVPRLAAIAVGEHDTASAVAAVPASQRDFAFLISGTWSLLGTELPEPILSGEARQANFTNEGGVYGTTRFLKNIMGLWLIQECKREWDLEGKGLSFARIVEQARTAEPMRCFIDPDASAFLNPVHMPREIQRYCRETGQYVPQTEGEIARCIFESLAFKYRYVLERMEKLANRTYAGLHMVGGGIQNELLCQLTADACGREIWAGPVEASALGNVIVQYIALGHVANLQEGRDIIRRSFQAATYTPAGGDRQQAYEAFLSAASLA